MYVCMYVCVLCIVCIYRRSPLDITLCSQTSNNLNSTIQPIDDAKVEIYFRIEDIKNVRNFATVVCVVKENSLNSNYHKYRMRTYLNSYSMIMQK